MADPAGGPVYIDVLNENRAKNYFLATLSEEAQTILLNSATLEVQDGAGGVQQMVVLTVGMHICGVAQGV